MGCTGNSLCSDAEICRIVLLFMHVLYHILLLHVRNSLCVLYVLCVCGLIVCALCVYVCMCVCVLCVLCMFMCVMYCVVHVHVCVYYLYLYIVPNSVGGEVGGTHTP